MAKLVIVESPGKIKTLQKYLGSAYRVMASVGHCYEIEPKDGSIDIDNNYEPKYVPIPKKTGVIKQLKEAAAKAEEIYIASDPDREGEAIGWHIAHRALGNPAKKIKRIIFHEITKSAVEQALKNPTTINEDLYLAQKARAVLDMLVGFKVSPVLWRKVCRGTSAGRVQSIGLRFIVDRQAEIDAFKPEEYWSITGSFLTPNKEAFTATYQAPDKLVNEAQANEAVGRIKTASGWAVKDTEKSEKKRFPYPPFYTSTLQQFCSSYFGWDGKRTMKLAQELYEGFSVGGKDATGLITYMRTDSTNISQEALDAARDLIKNKYGSAYLPASPKVYKTKSKAAQEAHEAIRPAHPEYTLAEVQASIPADNYKLYEAIYNRFIACQMTEAVVDATKVTINPNGATLPFTATGQVVKFDGFLKVWRYAETKDEALPKMAKDDPLELQEVTPEQHFTKPPAAYNNASLVKILEEKGIGRPSTYASIVDTLIKRGYVDKEGKAFKPTDLGKLVSGFLVKAFPELMDDGYTARIEDQLDEIAESKAVWYTTVDAFYKELKKRLDSSKDVASGKMSEETDITCPTCKTHKLVKRSGRFGTFYGCAGYKDKGKGQCKATFQIGDDGQPVIKTIRYMEGVKCDKCGSKIVIRTSKKSGKEFGGCSGFPKCRRMFRMDGTPIEEEDFKKKRWPRKK